jgi:hypothetical protein
VTAETRNSTARVVDSADISAMKLSISRVDG